jgi:hypothetical protein
MLEKKNQLNDKKQAISLRLSCSLEHVRQMTLRTRRPFHSVVLSSYLHRWLMTA